MFSKNLKFKKNIKYNKILSEKLKEFKLLILSCNETFNFIGGQ